MGSNNPWAFSVFKGRIGEALVEAVLMEFGYQVVRSGQEFGKLSNKGITESQRVVPDLLVVHPRSKAETYIEVKLRSARPMSVIVEKAKLKGLQKYYPNTVLVFVSSYNGSVNCAKVSSLDANETLQLTDGFIEFDLLTERWKPIWHFFPLVKPGERLSQHWKELKTFLHDFAECQVYTNKLKELFEDERESLNDYIENKYTSNMLQGDILAISTTEQSIDQLWKTALDINSFLFALDLCGEENIETREFQLVRGKVCGETGEKYLTIDINDIKEALQPYPELSGRFAELIEKHLEDTAMHRAGKQILAELYNMLPPGIGKAMLYGVKTPIYEGIEIDIRTSLALAQRRNCLDAET